jgi:cellobiose epimerase
MLLSIFKMMSAFHGIKKIFPAALLIIVIPADAQNTNNDKKEAQRLQLAGEIERSMREELLTKWYPRSIDSVYGGFITTFNYKFEPTGSQDKMIVTQARHIWSNSLASRLYPKVDYYKKCAAQGFNFLKTKMWDKSNGGFYTLVDRKGNVKDNEGKTAYGNAFGIYALAAWCKASGDKDALQLAKDCFAWLEKHAHDPVLKGYYQNLLPGGTPLKRRAAEPSTSTTGYKDQNSSIHLLEAFTELYTVWPDKLVRQRLEEMLLLVRDVITTDKGYLSLFLQPDWTPVSYRDSSEAVILKHRYIDHVSFGHDVETAYLMLEASHVLGFKNDTVTMKVAKRMVDHALQNGWDTMKGGFYDEGYYFKNKKEISIIKNSKNWWAQAEGLNTLLLMADQFPDDPMNYFEKFRLIWKYIQTYLIDHEYGDWYEEGLDNSPEKRTALKGHIWKATYHQLRALSNCVERLQSLNEKRN